VAFRSASPQLRRFTDNGLCLPHAHSLSVCLFPRVCVVCVCFLLCLSFYLCCARCVFCVRFLFSFFFFYKSNRHLCRGAYWCTRNPAHMPIFLFHLHLHFSNSCVCVPKHVYTFPSSSIFIHIYRHIHMYICFEYCVMTPYNFYAPIIKHLYVPAPKMSPDVYTIVTPCSRVCISRIIRVYASYECTHTMFMSKKRNSVCTCPLHMCVAQPRLNSYLFHPPKHVLTCGLHHARQ